MNTLLKEIEPGFDSRILIEYRGQKTEWMVIAHGHHQDDCTTIYPAKPFIFAAFDAKELPKEGWPGVGERGRYDWIDSNIRTWLNSNKQDWYYPKHKYDQGPSENLVTENPYQYNPGFLTGFHSDFLGLIQDVSIDCIKDSYQLYRSKETAFLLSRKELFGIDMYQVGSDKDRFGDKFIDAEGKQIPFFKDDESRQFKDDSGKSFKYWTRSGNDGRHDGYVTVVNPSGNEGMYDAYKGDAAVRPALCLSSSLKMKQNDDGLYEIIYNTSPALSINKINKQENLLESQHLKVTGIASSANSKDIKMSYSVNRDEYKEFDSPINSRFELNIPISSLSEGENLIRIKASNEKGEEIRSTKVRVEEKYALSKAGSIQYELNVPEGFDKSIFLNIERESGNTDIEAYLKVNDLNYVRLEKTNITNLNNNIKKISYVYTYPEKVEKLVLRIDMSRGELDVSEGITNISGSFF